jgi:hypothetical protein
MRLARLRSVQEFEERFSNTIHNYRLEPGTLVLVRNTRIEKELNRKSKARYLGPMIVVKQNDMGAFTLAELDGAVRLLKVAQFRVIPYAPRYRTRYNVESVLDEAQELMKRGDALDAEAEDAPPAE